MVQAGGGGGGVGLAYKGVAKKETKGSVYHILGTLAVFFD